MSVVLPETLRDACRALVDHAPAVPIAGATDLLVHWPQRFDDHEMTYVDLTRIEALKPHHWTDDALVLGGLTTYWDALQDVRIADEFPLLIDAGREVGAVQIQTRGTWAGNIVNASPAADGVPVLMAYGATLVLASLRGREVIPLDDFYLGYKEMRRQPDQIITEIHLPRRTYRHQMFEKVGTRRAQAITKVGLAVTVAGDDWRVVAIAMAPTVKRCPTVERMLAEQRPISGPDDLLPAIREDVQPIDDIRSSREYREQVMSRLLYYGLRDVSPAFS